MKRIAASGLLALTLVLPACERGERREGYEDRDRVRVREDDRDYGRGRDDDRERRRNYDDRDHEPMMISARH